MPLVSAPHWGWNQLLLLFQRLSDALRHLAASECAERAPRAFRLVQPLLSRADRSVCAAGGVWSDSGCEVLLDGDVRHLRARCPGDRRGRRGAMGYDRADAAPRAR